MTDRHGDSHVKRPKATAPAWLLVGDRGGFWWLASAVFAANGLVSAWQATWWLAVMQIVTAMLAVRAAVMARVAYSARGDEAAEMSLTIEPKQNRLVNEVEMPPQGE
jgi:hypothetical protein